MRRVKTVPEQFRSCARCIFSPDSKYLFLVKHNRDIDVFSIPLLENNNEIKLIDTIGTSSVLADSVKHVEISECGQFMVCSGLCSNIGVWKFQSNKQQWNHLLNLPKHKSIPTALTIHRHTPKVVVAFADSKVYISIALL